MNGQIPMFTAQKCGLQVSGPLLPNPTFGGVTQQRPKFGFPQLPSRMRGLLLAILMTPDSG
jgi:hypothetical protein